MMRSRRVYMAYLLVAAFDLFLKKATEIRRSVLKPLESLCFSQAVKARSKVSIIAIRDRNHPYCYQG